MTTNIPRVVAQISNLLYRGFPTRRTYIEPFRVRTPCRLEIGDTAGWKPALRPPHFGSFGYLGFLVPKGQDENSPAFQRRVLSARERVPQGRLNECAIKTSTVPSGLICYSPIPGVKTPGYSQMSLRDKKRGDKTLRNHPRATLFPIRCGWSRTTQPRSGGCFKSHPNKL